MALRTLILAALFGTLSLEAHAKGFLGLVGPFTEYQASTKSLRFTKCDPSLRELQFFVAKNGKHHVPRIYLESAAIQYSSGTEEFLDGKSLGKIRGFTVHLAAENGCVTSVTLKARAAGFNPGRTQDSSVEVWGY